MAGWLAEKVQSLALLLYFTPPFSFLFEIASTLQSWVLECEIAQIILNQEGERLKSRNLT